MTQVDSDKNLINPMTGTLPTISLVTPSYNQATFLRTTIESILSQKYPKLEYVIIDGASDDGSVQIISEYADELAYWVSEPDEGLYYALNKGFARTSGEIMGWLNSSDLHYPWTLRTVAEVFRDVPEAQWIMGVPTVWSESGDGPRSVCQTWWNRCDLLAGNYRSIQQESVFWRRTLWNAAGGRISSDLRFVGDLELWMRFFRLTPLYHLATVLAGFRAHDRRLGGLDNQDYQREAHEVWKSYRSSFGTGARARATMANLLTLGGAQPLRAVVGRLPLPAWYVHPQITFDHAVERWVVK
jgi:glycosyltransferase involved in cell wall biosynthesis